MKKIPPDLLLPLIPIPTRRVCVPSSSSLISRWCRGSQADRLAPHLSARQHYQSLPPSPLPFPRYSSSAQQQLFFLSTSSSSSSSNERPNQSEPDHNCRQHQSFKEDSSASPNLPFRFETGLALFAKRAPRPFPPPFLSPPSGSFSDPLSTHHRSRDRRPSFVNGQLIQGLTNGDDAVFASDYFICASDGVGAWSTRPRGHAELWARLILHFWASAIHEDASRPRRAGECYVPDPIRYLQRAYEQTIEATSAPNDWQGTTTASGAQLHYRKVGEDEMETGEARETTKAANTATKNTPSLPAREEARDNEQRQRRGTRLVSPLLYVTNLGDSQVMVVRPSARKLVFKTTEQWHWFDCPRQLGTNSPDTPRANAVVDAVSILEGDVVLAMSDGVIDNLWAHEIVENVSNSVARWEAGEGRRAAAPGSDGDTGDAGNGENGGISDAERRRRQGGRDGGMAFVAHELMEAAKTVALDPFAECPFMEHAIEEGLASEGGKLDDISVVAALCTRRET